MMVVRIFVFVLSFFFFFKQKTAYEMRISDWSSDVCSSDLKVAADHPRDSHRDRLPQHRRAALDAADAPPQDSEAIDHRRVTVGAELRFREGVGPLALPGCPDAAGERPHVDLMADAGAGRHDPELVEVLLRPAPEAGAATEIGRAHV